MALGLSTSDPYITESNNIVQRSTSLTNDVLQQQKQQHEFNTNGTGQWNQQDFVGDYNSGTVSHILNEGKQYLGMAYQWGGESPKTGFDCSGLVQYLYNKNGYHMPRTAAQQSLVGQMVSPKAARSGDLVFWGTPGAAHHVAIYMGNGYILESPHTGDVVKITRFNPGQVFFKRVI
jgi:cell wall-associated NlpC family hydrolase